MRSKGQEQSRKHEERVAKLLGGSRVPASGALWSRKGDVRTDGLLIEHKYTEKKSISITGAWLTKIAREAVVEGRTPVLAFHVDGHDCVLLFEDDFLEREEALQLIRDSRKSGPG